MRGMLLKGPEVPAAATEDVPQNCREQRPPPLHPVTYSGRSRRPHFAPTRKLGVGEDARAAGVRVPSGPAETSRGGTCEVKVGTRTCRLRARKKIRLRNAPGGVVGRRRAHPARSPGGRPSERRGFRKRLGPRAPRASERRPAASAQVQDAGPRPGARPALPPRPAPAGAAGRLLLNGCPALFPIGGRRAVECSAETAPAPWGSARPRPVWAPELPRGGGGRGRQASPGRGVRRP